MKNTLYFIAISLFLNFLYFSLSNKIHAFENENANGQIAYIYSGPGVSKEALYQVESMLRDLIDPSYQIKKIKPDEVKEGKWMEKGVLLVMPGGADLPYVKHLSSHGNRKIKEFVETGGAYLGFCAGAYYGCQEVNFAIGTSLEVVGKRELAFYQGLAEGPVLAPYDYQSNSGARVALVRWVDKNTFLPGHTIFFSYFNGGCHLVDTEKVKDAIVLAKYIEKDEIEAKTAIVEISVGKGRVILSGVHIEYSPTLMNDHDIYLKEITKKLKETDESRIQLMRHLLQRLNIKTKSV